MRDFLTFFPLNLTGALTPIMAGRHILAILAVLSVWIWVLAVVTFINLILVKKKGKNTMVTGYEKFCRQMMPLSPRPRKNMVRIYAAKLVHRTTGHVGTILLLASVAPLLGLLGTVDGMIDAFRVLARSGAADNGQLTAGISKALVTTQGGLLVAIPGLLAGGVIHRKAGKLANRLALICTSAGKGGRP